MINLIFLMIERVGLIIIVAYILMNSQHFKNILTKRQSLKTQLQLILIFGLFGIISNFTGVEISNNHIVSDQILTSLSENASLANTRVLTIGVSGLVGGPVVGTVVGLISGIARFLQGGEEAYIYVISSLIVGIFSGLYGWRTIRKNSYPSILEGATVGACMELVQMSCILMFGSSIVTSWSLVRLIAIPMTFINSSGTAIFLSIIDSTLKQEEQTRAVQTHDVLELANRTAPFFRSGLNEASCMEAAKIIKRFIKVSAVSITDTESILAHVGAGSDHHKPTEKIITSLSKEVLRTGKTKEAHSHDEIGCNHPGCPLEAAVVVPLFSKGRIVGTLKLYFTDAFKLTFVERQLAEGLGNIFSTQIELGEVELQGKLLQDAEIKSLQAQVNPHFFFNAINTISALIRVDPEKSRKLLIQLGHFFRANLQGARKSLIPLETELNQVEAYLSLEQARFPDRYDVTLDIEPAIKDEVWLPPFIIQILVENALKHAFGNRKTDNHVWVTVCRKTIMDKHSKPIELLYLSVKDNGSGIDKEKVSLLGQVAVSSEKGTGSALENLNKRLIGLLGPEAALHFDTSPQGTTVWCYLPKGIKQKEAI